MDFHKNVSKGAITRNNVMKYERFTYYNSYIFSMLRYLNVFGHRHHKNAFSIKGLSLNSNPFFLCHFLINNSPFYPVIYPPFFLKNRLQKPCHFESFAYQALPYSLICCKQILAQVMASSEVRYHVCLTQNLQNLYLTSQHDNGRTVLGKGLFKCIRKMHYFQ